MAERPKSIIQFLIESLFGKQSEKSGKVQGDPPPESPRRKIRWNRVLLVFLPILVAFILTRMAMFSVAESDQAVITTFGRFTKTVDAGLHFKLPWPIQRAYHLPVNRTQKIEIGYCSNRRYVRQRRGRQYDDYRRYEHRQHRFLCRMENIRSGALSSRRRIRS